MSGADALWGAVDIDALFLQRAKVLIPFPPGNRKSSSEALPNLPRRVHLEVVDPRELRGSQGWVVHQHVVYYLTGEWERTGRTSADRGVATNRFPIVVRNAAGWLTILAGHHRATAALIEARPLLARVISTDTDALAASNGVVVAVTPRLFLGTGDGPTPDSEVLEDPAQVRAALSREGLDDLEIDDRLSVATTGVVTCPR